MIVRGKKMDIFVLSDTHGLLRPQVREWLGKCDAVIHAGDLHFRKTAEEIRQATPQEIPLYMARGNNDRGWGRILPEYLQFELGDIPFYVVHDKKDLPEDLGGSRIIIYGHSHKYAEEWKDGRLYLNPGSCGRRRFRLDITAAVLHLEGQRISVERLDFTDTEMEEQSAAAMPGQPLECIQAILKRMQKGQQIGRISRELNTDKAFVEEVCRIYVTHPGVTPNGILDKMESNRTVQRG